MAGGSDFFLEIQARMNAGTVVSDLDAITRSIGDAKGKFSELERTSLGVGKALDKVGADIVASREKMAAAMKAGDTSGFWKAASAAEALSAKEAQLKAKAEATKSALDAETASLRKLADSHARAAGAARAEAAAEASAKAAGEQRKKGLEGFSKLGGPLGGIGNMIKNGAEAFDGLKGSIGSVGAGAAVAAGPILAVGTAVAAVGAAAAVATIAVAAFALSQADAARNTRLTLEAMTGSAEGAGQLKDAMSEVTLATGVQQDRLIDLTRDLQKAKVKAADIPLALKAIATQEAALGDTSGTADLIKSLEEGKTSAGKLANEMDKKFGGVVEQKMLGLDNQMSTLKENLKGLIPDFSIESILEGLAKLVDLFNVNTESGAALRSLLETLFGPLQEGVDDVIPKVASALEAFFLNVEIWTLKGINTISMLAHAFGNFGKALEKDSIIGPLIQLGKDMIDGIVKGITTAGAAVGDALIAPIKGGIALAKRVAAEAHSPSKASERELGSPLGEGVVVGIDKWGQAANDAFVDIATPPKLATVHDIFGREIPSVEKQTSSTQATGTDGGGDTFIVERLEININDVSDPEAAARAARRAFLDDLAGMRERRGGRRGRRAS